MKDSKKSHTFPLGTKSLFTEFLYSGLVRNHSIIRILEVFAEIHLELWFEGPVEDHALAHVHPIH